MTATEQLLAAHRCAQAKHPGAELARFRMRNGALHYCLWCVRCHQNVTPIRSETGKLYLSKSDAAGYAATHQLALDRLSVVSAADADRIPDGSPGRLAL